MKSVLLLVLLLACAGCKTTTFTYTRTLVSFGTNIVSSVTAKDVRWLMATSANLSGSVDPSNGVVRIDVTVKSKGDVELIRAISAGVTEGAVKGIKP